MTTRNLLSGPSSLCLSPAGRAANMLHAPQSPLRKLAAGKPTLIEGGQGNGFGFTQSTFHKLHCLANLRMMLAWHINGSGDKMTRDMNVHAIHCLEYIRGRELQNSDLDEEPIDTVDYKGMGIH